jgi:ABC-type transporter Mla subunit MlaD
LSSFHLLMDVLRLARDEGALDGEGLTAFSQALEERARLILTEQLGELQRDNAWRREAMAGLEESVRSLTDENAWRREAMTGLEESVRSLTEETVWRRQAVASLEEALRTLEKETAWRRESMASLQADLQKAAQAHEAILTHHRDVLGRAVAELLAISAVRFPGLRGVRQRLVTLAELLRGETQ